MRLDALAGLITAVFELKAVRAVTGAINANLPKDGPLGTIRPTASDLYRKPRPSDPPTPGYGLVPRGVERPSGLAGPVFDYYDRFGCVCRCEPFDHASADDRDTLELWTLDGPTPPARPGPIDPPWRHLPPVEGAGDVHVQVMRPRVVAKVRGAVLDVYA